MAIRQIRLDSDEIIRKVSKNIEVIDEKIKELADDMIDSLYAYDGLGLSAVQVGMLKRMIVYDISYIEKNGKKNPIVLINPVITSKSKKMITTEEGCLSFPNIFGCVDRYEKVTVEALNLDGDKVTIKAKDIEAVVLQHEIDHLDGKVFLDKAYNVYKYDPNENVENGNNKQKKKNKKIK